MIQDWGALVPIFYVLKKAMGRIKLFSGKMEICIWAAKPGLPVIQTVNMCCGCVQEARLPKPGLSKTVSKSLTSNLM